MGHYNIAISLTSCSADRKNKITDKENPFSTTRPSYLGGLGSLRREPYLEFLAKINADREPEAFLINTLNYSCREEVIGSLRLMQKQHNSASGFISSNQMVCDTFYIKVLQEYGIQYPEYQKRAESFSKNVLCKILSHEYYPRIETHDGSVFIAMANNTKPDRWLYYCSLLLYILRKSEIVSAIEEKFFSKDCIRWADFLNFLGKLFLTHDFGDSSNSNLGLSMFCYGLMKGSTFSEGVNGPSSAGFTMDFVNTVDFLREFYMEAFPDDICLRPERFSWVAQSFIGPANFVISNCYIAKHQKKEKK